VKHNSWILVLAVLGVLSSACSGQRANSPSAQYANVPSCSGKVCGPVALRSEWEQVSAQQPARQLPLSARPTCEARVCGPKQGDNSWKLESSGACFARVCGPRASTMEQPSK
jgi:hypothetical protein